MTNKGKNIDQFFKERFSDAELPLDGSEWGRLEQAIQPQSKRKFGFWWILGIGVALTVAGISVLNWSGNSQNKSIQTAQATIVDPQLQSQNEQINPNTNQNNQTTKINERKELDSKIGLSDNTTQNQPKLIVEDLSVEPSLLHNTKGNRSVENGLVKKDNGSVLPLKEFEVESIVLIESLSPDQLQKINLNPDRFNVSLFELSAVTKSVDPDLLPQVPPSKWTNSIVVSAQPYNQINKGHNNYSKNKNSNEVFGIGYEVGISTAYQFSNFVTSTGVLFEHQQTRYTKNGIVLTLYDSIPFIDHKLDTFYVPFNYRDTLIARQDIKAPSYQYISVPLQVSKTFVVGSKWNVETTIEARPQLLIGAKGETQTAINQITALSVADFQRFNMRLGGHATINFKPTQKLTLFTKIIYLDDLKPRLTMNGLDQKLRTAGISLGIKLQMN